MTEQTRTRLALAGGPLLGLLLFFTVTALGLSRDAAWTAAITAVCATWWVTEPIPIPATSIIPFAAFPLTAWAKQFRE